MFDARARSAVVEPRLVAECHRSENHKPSHSARPRPIVCLSISVALLFLATTSASGQVWTGGGTTGDWGDPSNWTPGVPASSPATAITFAGSNNLNTNQNIANPFD